MTSMWIQEKLNKQANEAWLKRKKRTEKQKRSKRASDALFKEGHLSVKCKLRNEASQNGEEWHDP
jgi:hypothetical protein